LKLDFFTIRRVKVNPTRTAKATRKRKIYQTPRIKGSFNSFSGKRCILCGEPLAFTSHYELFDMHKSCGVKR